MMPAGPKPAYKRVLLKLSGEALQSATDPICSKAFQQFASQLETLLNHEIEVAIVVGGGNWGRGRGLTQSGIQQVAADHMGILFTVVNGIALKDLLSLRGIAAEVLSSIEIPRFIDFYRQEKAVDILQSKKVLILCGGLGEALFTTDTTAAQRAIEVGAEVVLKASNVDGVYDSDPKTNDQAKKFSSLTYDEVIEARLAVMDMTAFCLCEAHQMPIYIFDFNQPNALLDAVSTQRLGTRVGGG